MGSSFLVPLVLGSSPNERFEADLALALAFWHLETDREKGGGLIRKKKAETITHVSLFYRRILITDFAKTMQAFDCCGISESRIRYSITPSFTRVPFYLMAENWACRPESYAKGLNNHSSEFEQAHEKYQYLIKGWITDSRELSELSRLIRFSTESAPDVANSLPQFIDSRLVSVALTELDKIKNAVHQEIGPLSTIKQKINDTTAGVLKPLNEEFARIEDRYNKEIDKIRPSVLENKEKVENNRMKQRQSIQVRFSGRLHDLQNKLDAAEAKIDAYDPYGGREPRGGIDKQYSIRDSAKKRIKELREQSDVELDRIDEKYDAMIDEQEHRITEIEDRKQRALEEPSKKINSIKSSANRLIQSIDNLIQSHESVLGAGSISGLSIPDQIIESESVLYLPIIVARISDGTTTRMRWFSCCSLKNDKSRLETLKGLVGMKSTHIEMVSETFANFMSPIIKHVPLQGVLTILIERCNLLLDGTSKDQVLSGIDKMVKRGLLKQKEAAEFSESITELFSSVDYQDLNTPSSDDVMPSTSDFAPMPIPLARFVNHEGVETYVEIEKLESLRNDDLDHLNRKAPSLAQTISKSQPLVDHLKNLILPCTKEHCIIQEENWVQEMLHMELANNNQFRDNVQRERPFNVGETGTIGSRIDFDVGGVGVEVKIFRSVQDFHRLASEMLRYKEKYQEIIIPYINAGGIPNDRLLEQLDLLQKHYPQIKAIIPLRCRE